MLPLIATRVKEGRGPLAGGGGGLGGFCDGGFIGILQLVKASTQHISKQVRIICILFLQSFTYSRGSFYLSQQVRVELAACVWV